MKIAFVQTYPIYHDLNMTTNSWLLIENRDKWMPALIANKGYEVELWGIANQASEHQYSYKRLGTYPIKLFEVAKQHRNSKFDYSLDLVEYARDYNADLFILKGIDGGAGIKLLEDYILPEQKPFVFVIGGKFYNKYVPKASGIFYETPYQKVQLINPGWKISRKQIDEKKLLELPKSVNTDHFKPRENIEKQYDIISAGRLVPNYKNYDALGNLSEIFNVALIGDGPLKSKLASKFPKLHLLGKVSHDQMPQYLNQGKIFFHTGTRDYFPRVIAEAMAVGLPTVGFDSIISVDVIPDSCGLRVKEDDYKSPISQFLEDKDQLISVGQNARVYAIQNYGISSSYGPMMKMLQQLNLISKDDEVDVEQ